MTHRLGKNLWASVVITFSAGVAVAASSPPAPPAESIPPLNITREASDPSAGVRDRVAEEQAAWDAEQQRRWFAELQRQADERAAEARAARAAAAKAAATAASRGGRRVPTGGVSVWEVLADCESGDGDVGPPYSWSNPRGTYSGPFQFADATWQSLGYSGRAADHDYATQLAGAQRLQARSGWGQWPSCSRRMRAAGYLP